MVQLWHVLLIVNNNLTIPFNITSAFNLGHVVEIEY